MYRTLVFEDFADKVGQGFAIALSALTFKQLRQCYAPADLKAGWPRSPVDEDADDEDVYQELVEHFRLLVEYYRIAAARGNAMLMGMI